MTKLDYSSQKKPINMHSKIYQDLAEIHDQLYQVINGSGLYHKINQIRKDYMKNSSH